MAWRWYATGPDSELGLGKHCNNDNPHYGQQGLDLSTWEDDAREIGGANWGWYAYDPDTNTGPAKFAYQQTPYDEWDYAGVNVVI